MKRNGVGSARQIWLSGGLLVVLVAAVIAGCGDDDADSRGVGAECGAMLMCEEQFEGDVLSCLTQFRGGYCGLTGCQGDMDCPEDSACIMHTDSMNYCFRTCVDKIDCNANRTVDNESNCSSNVTFVQGAMGRKACVPPSSSARPE